MHKSQHIVKAVIFGITAALCYSIMNLLAKLVANDTTESMTVFFRFLVGLCWILTVITYKHLRGKQFQVKTKHFSLHLLRASSGFIAMLSLYCSLRYIPLANATSLAMTYTLFIPILSAIFLHTNTNTKNWLALLTGFIGIIFILKPYGDGFNPMASMALISGLATAASFLGVHELAKDDKPTTILLYYFSLTLIFSGILSIFSWKTPNLATIINLFFIGVVGTIYQESLTRALMHASPKTVSPILYFSVIFSGVFDLIFWGNIPDLYFWGGMVLVGFGCVFSIKYAK